MASEREVLLPGGDAPLVGTLTVPDGGGRGPGVLIVSGSGPTDRNGNQPGLLNDSLRKLADGLAGCGVASLRTDKRGVGESALAMGDEADLTIDTFVADTRAWLGVLRAEPRVASVSLIGHSEGVLIATLAAEKEPVARLVLIAGLGERAGAVLRTQLAGIDMAPVLRRRTEATLRALEAGETVSDPPRALGPLFRPSVQPYLMSWLRLDPAAELARTTMPALVMQGTTDLQASVAGARRLSAARAGVTLDLVEGMNHVLRAVPAERAANLATYTNKDLPLAEGIVARLCMFLH